MKNYYLIICLLVFIGCNTIQADTNGDEIITVPASKLTDVDQLIKKSKVTKHIADSISKMSDMAVNRKVDRQVRVMTVLKYKVVELKQSNEVLKVEIDSLTNIGKPYNLLPISYNEDHR
jgi:hypothetical protein